MLNSVRAGAIQADAIRTNHIATGEITADRLAIGLGDNLLYNLIFANNAYGRRDINARGGDWSNCPTTKDCKECWRLITLSGTQAQFNTLADRRSWVDVCRQMVNVVAGKWYMASMHVGGFHCAGNLIVEKYSSDEREYQGVVAMTPCSGQSDITQKPNDFIDAYSGHFQKGLGQNARRIFVKFQAPETGKILLVMRVSYYAKNQTYADFYCAHPMLEECIQYTKEPSAWVNSGVTSIHGGSIVTDSITADKIGAGQVTTAHMIAGSIDGKVLRAGTVTADTVKANVSLSSPKISGGSFTGNTFTGGSISGTTITGTNINGNNISGGTISGTTISGSTISGGVIKGARFEGATGKFTGELEVTQLIGGGVIEQVSGTLKYESSGRDYVGQEYGENSSSPKYTYYSI